MKIVRLCFQAVFTLLFFADVHAKENIIKIDQPREFGNLIGDVLEQKIYLDKEVGVKAEALPRLGRVSVYFERVSGEISQLTDHSVVILKYQIVSAPDVTQEVALPEAAIEVELTGKKTNLKIPEYSISVSPLIPKDALIAPSVQDLKSDAPPPILSDREIRLKLMANILGLVVVVLLLDFLKFYSNSQKSASKSFFSAKNEIERIFLGGENGQDVKAAMIVLHGAFNSFASQAIFKRNLVDFFNKSSSFSESHAEIREFYELSERVFFEGLELNDTATAVEEIKKLSQKLCCSN